MKKHINPITPDRLIEASIVVLRAVAEVGQDAHGKAPYPPDLMGSPDQPDYLCDFTRWEVEEATAFLIRLGYLQPHTPSDAV